MFRGGGGGGGGVIHGASSPAGLTGGSDPPYLVLPANAQESPGGHSEGKITCSPTPSPQISTTEMEQIRSHLELSSHPHKQLVGSRLHSLFQVHQVRRAPPGVCVQHRSLRPCHVG